LTISVVLLAAGAGRRFGKQKQFLSLNGRPLFHWPLSTFHRVLSVTQVALVVPADRVAWARRYAARHGFKKVSAVVAGGAQRADSVRRGLAALDAQYDVVLIHDSARALVTADIVNRVANAARKTGAALAARPVADTIKTGREKGGRFYVKRTIPRAGPVAGPDAPRVSAGRGPAGGAPVVVVVNRRRSGRRTAGNSR
jgi:2-C-methyl-D-erythritol 4-phosphate cytidylyltransferase